MNLLAFDTSSEYLSVAVMHAGRVWQRSTLAEQRHSSLLLPWIGELLADAGMALGQLDAIVYGQGPGAFTGLRIGAGVAQGLCLGSGVPLCGVGSLLTLAEQADSNTVLTAIDARMHEAYLAAWQRQGDAWVALLDPQLARAETAPELALAVDTGIGTGFDLPWMNARYPLARILERQAPDATAMLRLAGRQLKSGALATSGQVELVYLRDQVAQTLVERMRA